LDEITTGIRTTIVHKFFDLIRTRKVDGGSIAKVS
jgi:hypothetical protein